MKETILCYNCINVIYIDEIEDYDEYWEYNTCWIIKCPHCWEINAIQYSLSVDFDWVKPNQEDLDNFWD